MKLILQLLLGLSLIFFTISCQNASSEELSRLRENPFPSFEEIYTHVNKQLTAPGENCQFGLAKKADGYYLKIIPYKNSEQQTPTLLKAWDAATKKHLKLDLDKYLDKERSGWEVYTKGLQNVRNSGKDFELNYFYGYPDYTTDLIALMKDQEDLHTNELEMLARAYSNEACDYIHPNQLGTEITATKDLPDPIYEKISESRISNFLRLAEQSLACYKKIKNKDPNYKTKVFDDLDLKVNHDLVNYYLLLRSVQENEAAEGMLKLVSYKTDAIAYAKELLDDCVQNSILITSGDTDTFPLWFVQEKMNYRKDVVVLNHSLLQAPWYFDYIKHTTPLKSSLTKEDYRFYYQIYVALTEESVTPPNYPEWLAQLKANKDPKLVDQKQVLSYEDVPHAPKNFLIDIQGVATNFSSRQGYLVGVDLCMLDLLHSNKERRFYSTSVHVFPENNLRNHFVKRNLVYELVPVEAKSNWDKESNQKLQENLQTHPIKLGPSKITEIQKTILYAKLFDWLLMPKDEIEVNKDAFGTFLKQVPFKTIIESSNEPIIELYAASLIVMDLKKADQFLDSYAPKALEIIASIDNQGVLQEKDAEALRTIYKSYVDRKRTYSPEVESPSKDSEIQQKVVRALTNKVTILCDNPLNTKNLSWTLEDLTEMKNRLTEY